MTDLNIFVAFAAGVFSFLSPCVLPLIPSYLSFVSGASLVLRFINSATKIPPGLPLAKGGEPLFGKERQGRFENTLP